MGLRLTQDLDAAWTQDSAALHSLLGDTRASADRSLSNVNATTEQVKE